MLAWAQLFAGRLVSFYDADEVHREGVRFDKPRLAEQLLDLAGEDRAGADTKRSQGPGEPMRLACRIVSARLIGSGQQAVDQAREHADSR